MKNKIFLLVLLILIAGLVLVFKSKSQSTDQKTIATPVKQERTWQVKSIDTMKYSRDLAAEKLNDPSFDKVIDSQMKAIGDTNANYVAIATPYDEKFVPILTRWVKAARKYNLNVWFRGNLSGWEGWFGEERSLSREEHAKLVIEFIKNNPSLFKDGDIFSPCPECENGGTGDPRVSGDIAGFRKFMVDEHKTADEEFAKIGIKVATNFASMNYDVAKLVMDKPTVGAMGNLIAIDHYVQTPQKLADNIDDLTAQTGAKIFLGEIGVPVPDITGTLNDSEQADWLEEALRFISKKEAVIGINYWVLTGGSTAIFKNDMTPKLAGEVLIGYYRLTRF